MNTPECPNSFILDWIGKTWIIDPAQGIIRDLGGKTLGTVHAKGYIVVQACNRQLQVHHIIWWKHYGKWPVLQLDHRDKDKTNNRISNLFEVSHSQQMRNRVLPSSRPHRGVQVTKGKPPKYEVRISIEGKTTYLGTYDTLEKAASVYNTKYDQLMQQKV
jgi:hypothetical protein